MKDEIALIDIHAKLSELAFATQFSLGEISCSVKVEWNKYTYLNVVVECQMRNVQRVVDILSHGAISGDYDYRFESIAYPTGREPYDWVEVPARPNFSWDEKRVKDKKNDLASR